MNKKIVLIALMMLMFLLSGCKADDYKKAVALIEDGQYEEARDIFNEIPQYKDVEEYLAHYKTVEITEENWQDYFTVGYSPYWEENDFDEGKLLGVQSCVFLKEDYEAVLVNADVAMEFEYVFGLRMVSYDPVNYTYTIEDTPVSVSTETNRVTVNYPNSPRFGPGYQEPVDATSFRNGCAENLKLIRVKGSIELYLSNES